jgi:triacylglycerol lipase
MIYPTGKPAYIARLLMAVILALPAWAAATENSATLGKPGQCVVLLHGFARTELSMMPLQWGLEEAGFAVVSPTYPSLFHPIQELAILGVEQGIEECHALGLQRLHFVTHSLGGVLVRQYLSQGNIAGLERVVMLGPPNQGSQTADYVTSLSLLRPLTPEAVEQLGTGDRSIPRRLGPVMFELGVIAGTGSLGLMPGSPEGASDGTVAVEETMVPGMLDFLEMPVGHTFMMWDDEVLRQVIHFLRYGRFDRGAGGEA